MEENFLTSMLMYLMYRYVLVFLLQITFLHTINVTLTTTYSDETKQDKSINIDRGKSKKNAIPKIYSVKGEKEINDSLSLFISGSTF